MEKKLVSALIAIATLAVAQISFAGNVANSYQTTKAVSGNTKATACPCQHATDINVKNISYDNFYVLVPNTTVNDIVPTGFDMHLIHDTFYGETHLVLKDLYNQNFFDGYVCRHAKVVVSGSRYNYNINIDRSLC